MQEMNLTVSVLKCNFLNFMGHEKQLKPKVLRDLQKSMVLSLSFIQEGRSLQGKVSSIEALSCWKKQLLGLELEHGEGGFIWCRSHAKQKQGRGAGGTDLSVQCSLLSPCPGEFTAGLCLGWGPESLQYHSLLRGGSTCSLQQTFGLGADPDCQGR